MRFTRRLVGLLLAGAWGGGMGAPPASGQALKPANTALFSGSSPSFPVGGNATSVTSRTQDAAYLGGDAAYMCALAPTTSAKQAFFTFCDIAIGAPGSTIRAQATPNVAIGNSIALAVCTNGNFNLTHYYRGSVSRPLAFFPDPDNPPPATGPVTGSRTWPRKAIYNDDTNELYVFASQTYGGTPTNTFIYRIQDPLNTAHNPANTGPWSWTIDWVSINHVTPSASTPANFYYYGTEAQLGTDGYIYTYAIYAPPAPAYFQAGFKTYPFRVPVSALRTTAGGLDIGSQCQYRNSAGQWVNGNVDAGQATDLGYPAFNGFSVRYNPDPGMPAGQNYQFLYNNDLDISNIPNVELTNTAHTYVGYANRTNSGPAPTSAPSPPATGTYYFPRPPAYGEAIQGGSAVSCYQTYIATGSSMYTPFSQLQNRQRAGVFPQMVRDDGVYDKTNMPHYPYNIDIWCAWAREMPEFAVSERAISFAYTTYSYSDRRKGDLAPGNQAQLGIYQVNDSTIYTSYWYPVCNPLFAGCNNLPAGP